MLCSFGGLVTDAARDEMQPSSCSLVTTPSLILSTTSLLGSKGNCLVVKKSRTLTQLLDCKTSADKPRVSESAGLSQLVDAGVLQNFTNTICNEDWVFID